MGNITVMAAASSNLNFATQANTTTYQALGCCQSTFDTTTEAAQQVPFVKGGTLSNLGIVVSRSFAATTYNSRIAGANGNQTVSAPNAKGLTQDTTHTDSVTAGQLVCLSAVGGTDFQNICGASMQYDAGTDFGAPYCVWVGTALSISLNTTGYWPVASGAQTLTQAAAENDAVIQFPAITASNLFCYTTTNTFLVTQTFTLRKNKSTSLNNTISISAGVTGLTQDTTHSDSIAANDYLAIQSSNTSGGGKSFQFSTLGFWSDIPSGGQQLFGSTVSNGTPLTNSGTVYSSTMGEQISSGQTDETETKMAAATSLVWSTLHIRVVAANAINVPITLTSRIGGANGNQIVSVPASGSGDFVDNTHSDSVTRANLIDVQLASSGGTGLGSYYSITNYYGVTAPPPPPISSGTSLVSGARRKKAKPSNPGMKFRPAPKRLLYMGVR